MFFFFNWPEAKTCCHLQSLQNLPTGKTSPISIARSVNSDLVSEKAERTSIDVVLIDSDDWLFLSRENSKYSNDQSEAIELRHSDVSISSPESAPFQSQSGDLKRDALDEIKTRNQKIPFLVRLCACVEVQ